MGDYTILSEVSEAFLTLLKTHLVPGVMANSDGILLCGPNERGDATLGIHLYDIQENDEFRVNGMMTKDVGVQAFPSTFLSLYYMVTAYSGSDATYRAMEEQRILGRVVQVVKDYHTLHNADSFEVRLDMMRMQTEEKMKLWNMANQPYKPSLFYKASPVELESLKEKKIKRVGELRFTAVGKK